MDDFSAGPHTFDIIINSFDKKVVSQANEPRFTAQLGKGLELTSGVWEVALRQIIFKPLVSTLREEDKYRTISIKFSQNGTINETIVKLSTSRPVLNSVKELVDMFNNSIPEDLKPKLFLTNNSDYLTLNTKGAQIKFLSPYLQILFGFPVDSYIPRKIYDEQKQTEGSFKPNLNGGCEIFKVLVDFTVPEIYGSSNIPIMGIDVFPQNRENLSYPVCFKFSKPSYVTVLRSYISSIGVSIVDIYDNSLSLVDFRCPIILTFNFRRRNPLF